MSHYQDQYDKEELERKNWPERIKNRAEKYDAKMAFLRDKPLEFSDDLGMAERLEEVRKLGDLLANKIIGVKPAVPPEGLKKALHEKYGKKELDYWEVDRKTDAIRSDRFKDGKKWDFRFLALATEIASWSKDPSRKVGAVIVALNKSIISLGYNGFARGVADTDERYVNRETKYELVIHAEINAIISASRDLQGTTMYTTLLPCSRCAGVIINAGIKKVVTLENDLSVFDNSKVHFDLTKQQFAEAGVACVEYKLSEFLSRDGKVVKPIDNEAKV